MFKRLTLLLFISFFALVSPLNVSAHAILLDALPKEGSQLKQMPDKVSLVFNERLGEGVSSLQVRNSSIATSTNLALYVLNALIAAR